MPKSAVEDELAEAGTSPKLNTASVPATMASSWRPGIPVHRPPTPSRISSRDGEHRPQATSGQGADLGLLVDIAEDYAPSGHDRSSHDRASGGKPASRLPVMSAMPRSSRSPILLDPRCHRGGGRSLMLLAGAVRGMPGIAIPVRLHWGSCQHADQVASQAARCARSFGSRLAYWHCLPGRLDPLVGGVDVDEQFAGPAEVFTLPYREPGGCSDGPQ